MMPIAFRNLFYNLGYHKNMLEAILENAIFGRQDFASQPRQPQSAESARNTINLGFGHMKIVWKANSVRFVPSVRSRFWAIGTQKRPRKKGHAK